MMEELDVVMLKRLAERLLRQDYNAGSQALCPANPEDVVWAEDVMEAYGEKAQFLRGEEWEYLAKLVNGWNEEKLKKDEGFQEMMSQEALFDEIINKCSRVPSYEQVKSKLGETVAENFLVSTEAIESNESLNAKIEEDREKKYSKSEIQDIVAMIEILANGDKASIVEEYEAFKRIKQRENHEKRERVKENNTAIIKKVFIKMLTSLNHLQKVKNLNIWFPCSGDEWKTDPRTRDKVLNNAI